MELSKERAREIVADLLINARSRFKQELAGENEEFLDRVVRQYRAKVARCSWKASQKWCKWNDEGPVLMPDYTRMYYRKGNTEVMVLEYPPQVRLVKFKGSLALRESSTDKIDPIKSNEIMHYSLALPYVVFIFKYVNGVFTDVRCAFSDRPLKRLEEKPMRPYQSNIDNNLSVCLGKTFDSELLIKDNIVQQSAYVLNHFWQTIYSDDWSQHFWNYKTHFAGLDSRMTDLPSWQAASIENSLFVVEDVQWLPYHEDSFGDVVVRMFDDDTGNVQLHEELYTDLVNNFLEEVTTTFTENLDTVEQKTFDGLVDQLADNLIASIK